MSTLYLIPGELNLVFVIGDDLPITVQLNTNVTNVTFETGLYRGESSSFLSHATGTDSSSDDPLPTIALQVTNTSSGTLALSLTETETATLSATESYRWFLRMTSGGITRTVLAGSAEARLP